MKIHRQIFIDVEIYRDRYFIAIVGREAVATGCGLPFFTVSQIVGAQRDQPGSVPPCNQRARRSTGAIWAES